MVARCAGSGALVLLPVSKPTRNTCSLRRTATGGAGGAGVHEGNADAVEDWDAVHDHTMGARGELLPEVAAPTPARVVKMTPVLGDATTAFTLAVTIAASAALPGHTAVSCAGVWKPPNSESTAEDCVSAAARTMSRVASAWDGGTDDTAKMETLSAKTAANTSSTNTHNMAGKGD